MRVKYENETMKNDGFIVWFLMWSGRRSDTNLKQVYCSKGKDALLLK